MAKVVSQLIKILCVVVVFALASPRIALAQFYTGNTLKPLLEAHNRMQAFGTNAEIADVGMGIRAESYVAAVWDSVMGQNLICNPTQVTINQLLTITSRYIDSRPQEWGYSAYWLTLAALINAFPCQKPSLQPQPTLPPSR